MLLKATTGDTWRALSVVFPEEISRPLPVILPEGAEKRAVLVQKRLILSAPCDERE